MSGTTATSSPEGADERPQGLFISFNSKDRQKAEWVAWTLKDAGYEVAVHTWEIPKGGDIPAWMNRRLAWADRLIAIISRLVCWKR